MLSSLSCTAGQSHIPQRLQTILGESKDSSKISVRVGGEKKKKLNESFATSQRMHFNQVSH